MKLKLRRKSPKTTTVRLWFVPALTIAGLLMLGAAPSALGANSSSNWAGYAIHRSGVKFEKVRAVWTQPTASCQAGRRSYSAYWVGLGGYSESSPALEQIGTEVDCSASGRVQSSAWYELVPAASRTIRFRVRPGDQLSASVTVVGHRVTVSLYNATTKRTFHRTIHAKQLDVSSADWIVEAPSDCISNSACQTLPLADFGSASFGLALAQTTRGHAGSISDRSWRSSKIALTPGGGRRFVASQGSSGTAGEAIPSALNATGTGFDVTYSAVSIPSNPFMTVRRPALRAGYLVHGGR